MQCISKTAFIDFTTASQPNGGKPPHHKVLAGRRQQQLQHRPAIAPMLAMIIQRPGNDHNSVARGLAPVGVRSALNTDKCNVSVRPHSLILRLLRSRTGAAPSPQGLSWPSPTTTPAPTGHAPMLAMLVQRPGNDHNSVARGLAPVGVRSAPKTDKCDVSARPHSLILRLLRSRTGASPLTTRS